jgi:hypothetical protein
MPAVLDGKQVESIRQAHQAVSLSSAPTSFFVFSLQSPQAILCSNAKRVLA